jgi:anti-sigma B factor antagonist
MHRVSLESTPTGAVVEAGGELDAYTADDLASAFARTLGEPRLVIDLEAVSFLDSTALGVIVRALREAAETGVETRIVLPRGPARRIFELTTLDKALPVAGSREAALADDA